MMDATLTSVAKPYLDDGDVQLYHGDAITILQGLPSGIAQTCITSPPYWGLRDYGTGTWTGGDPECDHIDLAASEAKNRLSGGHGSDIRDRLATTPPHTERATVGYHDQCGRCGAQRTDNQLGLEASPSLYVERIVAVFREVRRVLRDDGTLWLNLGDSYASGNGGDTRSGFNERYFGRPSIEDKQGATHAQLPRFDRPASLKQKDLVGIPWRVAFALQADGWYLRSDIIWSKPNPMPESVTDRPTKAHEYLFLFSKQPRYFYDADAIREPHTRIWNASNGGNLAGGTSYEEHGIGNHHNRQSYPLPNPAGRNRRSVWTIPTEPFPEAHFATYPQALVQPCILAGTSERGECVECGAPRERQVERELEVTRGQAHSDTRRDPMDASSRPGGIGDYQTAYGRYRVETTGWEPTCYHTVPSVAQLVLDPFIGSGTTALVARKHGRRCIGIDLSAEYLAIAAKRTQQLSLLGLEPQPGPPLERKRGLTGGAYSPPGQTPHSNARDEAS